MPPRVARQTRTNPKVSVTQAPLDDISVDAVIDEILDDEWFKEEPQRTPADLTGEDVNVTLKDMWDSAPIVYDEERADYVVTLHSSGFEVRASDADEVFISVPKELQEARDYIRFLEAQLAKQRLDIEDLQTKLAEAIRPTETETIAALRTDMADVQSKMRREIEDFRTKVSAKDLENTRLRNDLANKRRMAQTIKNFTTQLAAEEPPQLSGRDGQTQRDLEQALNGTQTPAPLHAPSRSGQFNDLEID